MTCKRTGRRPPERLRLQVESLAFGGDGVGHDADGRVVFLPGVAPGDEVEATLVEAKKGYARAELERVIRPSPERVAPPCPWFEAGCGGCQWQHVALEAQQQAKAEVVRRALRHAGGEVRPLLAPAPAYGWRRRARLRWRGGVLGYAARRSHKLIDVPTCPQLEPPLEAALQRLRAGLMGALPASGELSLLLGGGGAVHAVLTGRGVRAAAEAARTLVGEAIAGIVLRDDEGVLTVGSGAIDLGDDEGGAPFWARADVFAQVSAAGNMVLRRLVREAAAPLQGSRVLELHAGSGNFTRDLAAEAAELVAVEEASEAAALGRRNLEARRLRADLRCQTALAAVSGLSAPVDVVVVDPPRTGLEPGLAEALARLAPRRLVYVSCDPPTLARDLAALGMPLAHATPVDLMPQTFHVEVVAVATRLPE